MAIPKIKATYSLDAETVGMLERLALRWKTSKSETLRRLIRRGGGEEANDADDGARKIAALKGLQKAIGLSAQDAEGWMKGVRAERRASSDARSGSRR